MDIKEEILQEHSKEQMRRVADYIGDDPQRVAEMMNIFFHGESKECQRIAWVVSIVGEKYPQRIVPYLPEMLKNLDNPVHDAVIRCTVRFMETLDIPEPLMGEVADRCYAYLQSPQVPVAIRVFAMTVLYNISNTWPELKPELMLIIETHMPFGTAGFLSRGKKLLHKLRKETE
ncbi:MAG: hypothetical protein R3D00_27470 [Bacteroidia bacterium]